MCQGKFLLFSRLKWTWKVSNFASSTFKKLGKLLPPAKLAACLQSPVRWGRPEQSACFLLKDTVPRRRNVSPAGKLSSGKDPGQALLQSRPNSPRKPPGCFAPSKNSLALRSGCVYKSVSRELEKRASNEFQNWSRNDVPNFMCPAGQMRCF